MNENFIELLKEALRARLKTPSLPPKLNMEPHKEYILRLTGTIDNPFRPGTRFYTVINLEDGIEYRLPPNFQLEQILKDAKTGDYILLIYYGSVQTSKQRTVKQYAGAILSSEEAEKLLQSTHSKSIEVKEEKKEEIKEEKKEEKKEETKKTDEVKKFIESLIEVYGSVKVSEVDYYINKVKKMNIEITPGFLESLGFIVEDGRVKVKK